VNYLTQWSFDPFVVVAAAIVVVHEVGLAHLAARSLPERTAARRRRSLLFYAGLALLVLVVVSPLDYWADRYFFVHMIEHILLMFFAPLLVVVGAPWLPLLHALPVRARRRVLRFVLLGPLAPVLRCAGRFASGGILAVVAFNVVMVVWHLPGPFDLAARNPLVHIWLMHGSFFVAGVLFWLQIVPSYPFHRRLSPIGRIGAILGSNVVMLFLAMAMSILTKGSWYTVYAHVPGVTLSSYADQQIGAAILWVCGDFWALPALVYTLRRLGEDEGSLGVYLDRLIRQVSGAGGAARPDW
jgi:putative membrane protein